MDHKPPAPKIDGRLRSILDEPFPRFSDAEMHRRRQAVERQRQEDRNPRDLRIGSIPRYFFTRGELRCEFRGSAGGAGMTVGHRVHCKGPISERPESWGLPSERLQTRPE